MLEAIRIGDVEALRGHLREHPELATTRWDGSRTLLHVVTDWPGHRPNSTAAIAVLIDAGAHVDAPFGGAAHDETPLHWAASNDDVDSLDALLDAGADIDAPGAVIGGGTPLNDATAFAQWNAARRLVERGATSTLFDAGALGLVDRVAELLRDEPEAEEITGALWGACHGGQRATAELLLAQGADFTWVGWDDLTPLQAAERAGATDLAAWLRANVG